MRDAFQRALGRLSAGGLLLVNRVVLVVAAGFAVLAAAWYAWSPCEGNPAACAPLDCAVDVDLDGLPDRDEVSGAIDGRATDPIWNDTDDDGLFDADDPCPTDPTPPRGAGPEATCADDRPVRPPADADRDGLRDVLEGRGIYAGTRPDRADSDGDGLPDGRDICPGARDGDDPIDRPLPEDDPQACQSGRPLAVVWHARTSLAEKYACWAGNMASGRVLGADGMPIVPRVLSALGQTLMLVVASLLLSGGAAVVLVVLLHLGRDRRLWKPTISLALAASFIPIVLVGYLLGAAFNSEDFQVFRVLDPALVEPCFGAERRFSLAGIFGAGACLGDYLVHLAIPAAVLALGDGNLGYLVRDLSRNLAEVDRSRFVDYARVRGVGGWTIVVWYLLPNVAVLSLIFLRQRTIFLLSGAVVVERMFTRDGLGRLLIDALSDSHDVPLLLTCAMVFFAVAIAVQLSVRLAVVLIERRATT